MSLTLEQRRRVYAMVTSPDLRDLAVLRELCWRLRADVRAREAALALRRAALEAELEALRGLVLRLGWAAAACWAWVAGRDLGRFLAGVM